MYRDASFPAALLLFALAFSIAAAEPPGEPASTAEILLESELLVSGPQVWVRWPYGSHYHPGALMVLEGRVVWPGGAPPAEATEVEVREQEGRTGPRYGMRFPPGGAGAFRFPVQAGAGVPTLRLTLWQDVHGEPQDLVRASLAGQLKVLSSRGRVVLRCGQISRLSVPPEWHVVPVTPERLPDEPWMYDNVDLVILGRGSFLGATEPSVEALRNWVLGGGRLLIASADPSSADVLDGAVRAGLTPIPPDSAKVPSRAPLWPDMPDDGVELDERKEIVYARYRLGLGGGLFFLPSADANAVGRLGMKAPGEPVLQARRVARSDARVWRQAFEFFAPGAVPAERRNLAVQWAVVGALIPLMMLAFARKIRTRYLAAGLCVAVVALLASLLARTFPRPELTVARFELVDASLDGRARGRTEWALCEGSWDPAKLVLHAQPGATMSAQHYSPGELRESPSTLLHGDALAWGFSCEERLPAAPLFVCRTVAGLPRPDGEPMRIDVPGEGVRLTLPRTAWRDASWERGTLWLSADGRRLELKPEGAAWTAARMTDEARFLRELFPRADEATVSGWARALSFALDDAKADGRACLIRCADRLSGAPLILPEGAETESGVSFSVLRVEVEQEATGP